jgi:hypothetical protein
VPPRLQALRLHADGRSERVRARLMWGCAARRRAPELPEALWQATLKRYPFLGERAAADVPKLRALAAAFLTQKEFHGAGGLVITDEIALAIAAQGRAAGAAPGPSLVRRFRRHSSCTRRSGRSAQQRGRDRRGARLGRSAGRAKPWKAVRDGELARCGAGGRHGGNRLQRGHPRIRAQDRPARRRTGRMPSPALRERAPTLACGAGTAVRALPRTGDRGRALRRRAALAGRLRRDGDRRVLRRGLRGLFREPRALRAGVPELTALFDGFYLPQRS